MERNNDRLAPTSRAEYMAQGIWIGLIVIGLSLIVILIGKVVFYRDSAIAKYCRPKKEEVTLIPTRGNILDCKGRILATSSTIYEIRLDCKIAPDSIWNKDVYGLAAELSRTIGGRSADSYLQYLQKGRKTGKRYLLLAKDVSQTDIAKVRTIPILREGRFKGGYMESPSQKRNYPYGSCAFRTIGYVRDNSDKKNRIGIEGSYDSYLHGCNGLQVFTKSDFNNIPTSDKKNRKAVHGKDIRTTIDIDIQTIADKALRSKVEDEPLVEKSCVIVLERATGAVKAMVNLGRNGKGQIGEWDNYAIRTAEAPGSVFKGVVLTALLEEGDLTTLETEVPTNKGVFTYNKITYKDLKHLGPQRFPSGRIKVREAFEMSANNTFMQLICDENSFGNNPARFVEKVKNFGLFDTIAFDIKGNTPPFILEPKMKKRSIKGSWDGGTFPRMAIGYGMELPPLNIVTFYNAIANDGKMMKPYRVEDIMENGKVTEHFPPVTMRESICSKATADTLKRALSRVTSDKSGTAYWQLHGAVCPIAGKTGTAQRLFRMSNGRYGYRDADGRESQQGSFVGFFPVENPKYTAIVVVWAKPTTRNFYGATWAAPVFREIADKIYCLNEN